MYLGVPNLLKISSTNEEAVFMDDHFRSNQKYVKILLVECIMHCILQGDVGRRKRGKGDPSVLLEVISLSDSAVSIL